MTKFQKKIFIVLFLLILLIIISLLILLVVVNKTKNENNNSIEGNIENSVNEEYIENSVNEEYIENYNMQSTNSQFELITNKKYYLIIEDKITDLVNEMKLVNTDESIKREYPIQSEEDLQKVKQELKENLNNQLSKDFKTEFSIDQIFDSDIFKNIIMNNFYSIEKVYQRKDTSKIKLFIVFGKFAETDYSFIFALDSKANAFCVYLDDYLKKYNYTEENISDIKLENLSIEKNNDNTLYMELYKNANEKIIKRYYTNTKLNLYNNQERLYSMLDGEYKQKKFTTLEQFKKFATSFKMGDLAEFKVKELEGETQISCKDEFKNTYIFKETSIMNYKVILDPYTVNIETINSEYTKDIENNIQLNIEKLNQMINMKDYDAIYEKLNTTFRENNFKNVNDLKMYMENKLYINNKLELVSIQNNEDYYILDIRVTDRDKTIQKKLMKIAMKLLEENNFEISFSFE